MQSKSQRGFTIVELLIVIVVIGILAAITLIAFNGIQQRATLASMQSDLENAAKAMEGTQIDTGSYATAFPSNVKPSPGIALSLSTATTYCINAQTTSGSPVRYYINPTSNGPTVGTCSGAVIYGSEVGMNKNLVMDTNFAAPGTSFGNWGLIRGSITSIAGVTRAGTSTDPFPNRPVLQISNVANASASYSYVTGPVDWASIGYPKNYTVSYYVRLSAGTYTTAFASFGVMNASATNVSVAQASSYVTPTSSWQFVTRTAASVANGISGTGLYMSMSNAMTQTNNYTLEFQGFTLQEN